jgi:hypothetical protein
MGARQMPNDRSGSLRLPDLSIGVGGTACVILDANAASCRSIEPQTHL